MRRCAGRHVAMRKRCACEECGRMTGLETIFAALLTSVSLTACGGVEGSESLVDVPELALGATFRGPSPAGVGARGRQPGDREVGDDATNLVSELVEIGLRSVPPIRPYTRRGDTGGARLLEPGVHKMKILTTLMATSAAVAWLIASAGDASAADHRDGAAVKTDPSTDINDVYAWVSPDGSKVYLGLTVFPVADAMAKFSNTAKYVFHLRSGATYGATSTQDVRIICTFAADQKISCWVVQGSDTIDYLTGDASATAGLTSASGKTKVFAGLRDDPFYFNLAGFQAVATAAGMAAPGLMFDPAGCPTIPPATAMTLVEQLSTRPGGGAAENFFANLNTLAIVVAVDKAMVTPGGPIIGVWGSTNR